MAVLTNTTPSSTRSAALGGKRAAVAPSERSSRRRRGLILIGLSLAVLGLVAAGTVALQTPAEAAPAATSPGSPASGIASPTPTGPAVAPTIDVDDSAAASFSIGGTATPGAELRVLDPAHPASSLCPATAAADGTWSCVVELSSGAGQRLTVRDLTDTSLADVQSSPFSVLTAPVLSTSAGIAVGARVSGTAYAGASVVTTLTSSSTGRKATISATADSAGSWQATLPASAVPSGTYLASATQSSRAIPDVPVSSSSNTISITIDREAPGAPRLVHPAAGSTVAAQPLVFDGTGEEGDTVTTYVDSNPVCTAVVTNGAWSCTSTGLLIPAGTRTVQAAQRDSAGNYGAPSAGVKVTFADAAASAVPTAPASPSASGQPGQPQPAPSSSGTVPTTPDSGGAAGGGTSGGSGGGSGSGGAAGGSGGTSGQGTGSSGGSVTGSDSSVGSAASWTGSTGFGRNLPTLAEGLGGWAWAWALGLGLVFVLLVLAPLRLAASALGGRLAVRAAHLTGRNRARSDARSDETPFLSPLAATALTLAGGALLVALAAGVDDQVRYVRLVVAIIIGLGLINGLGLVLPTWLTGRRLGLRLHLRVSPRMLAAAALACLATRVFDLDPPMVLGVLLAAGLVDGSGAGLDESGDRRSGGILATVQLSSLALLSFAAWVAHGVIPVSNTDFAVEISRETLATVCLAGLGSLMVLLLPLGNLPGRALYSWSKPTLVGLGVVGVAMAAVVYAGDPDEAFPVMPLLVAAVAFAVVALSTWAWVRYVEPADDVA